MLRLNVSCDVPLAGSFGFRRVNYDSFNNSIARAKRVKTKGAEYPVINPEVMKRNDIKVDKEILCENIFDRIAKGCLRLRISH